MNERKTIKLSEHGTQLVLALKQKLNKTCGPMRGRMFTNGEAVELALACLQEKLSQEEEHA